MSGQPWDFDQARAESLAAEQEQRRVESEVTLAFREYAKAERLYRVALARRIWELKRDGIAVTACENLAKGDPAIAALKEERDSKEGLKETAKVAAWRVNADRHDVRDFIQWSMRRDLAEGYGAQPTPKFTEPIGARR